MIIINRFPQGARNRINLKILRVKLQKKEIAQDKQMQKIIMRLGNIRSWDEGEDDHGTKRNMSMVGGGIRAGGQRLKNGADTLKSSSLSSRMEHSPLF